MKVSSFSCDSSLASEVAGDCTDGRRPFANACGECEWSRDSMSIFSSFSSSNSFSSRTSPSKSRTRSSSDSVYPLGNARRLSLSLVLHSKPTLVHCVQLGRMPSQRIFLERHRSQACAMRDWQLDPTLITFMGNIPGMLAMYFFCGVVDWLRFSLGAAGPTMRLLTERGTSRLHPAPRVSSNEGVRIRYDRSCDKVQRKNIIIIRDVQMERESLEGVRRSGRLGHIIMSCWSVLYPNLVGSGVSSEPGATICGDPGELGRPQVLVRCFFVYCVPLSLNHAGDQYAGNKCVSSAFVKRFHPKSA